MTAALYKRTAKRTGFRYRPSYLLLSWLNIGTRKWSSFVKVYICKSLSSLDVVLKGVSSSFPSLDNICTKKRSECVWTSWPSVHWVYWYSSRVYTVFLLQAGRAYGRGVHSRLLLTWVDTRYSGGAPAPLLKGIVCFQALIEFRSLWFYLEFSRQFCQNRLRREQIQLLLLSNRLGFQGANLGICHGYAPRTGLAGVPGWMRKVSCYDWLSISSWFAQRGGGAGYSFITKEGQWDECWLWKYIGLR